MANRLRAKLASAWLLAQLLVLTSLAQLMIAVLPFSTYARWLQRPSGGSDAPPELVRSLRRKLGIAARLLPWKPQCFPQALAGRFVLARRGYRSQFSLGVADPSELTKAHAWLTSGGLFVSGREEFRRYREVARF